MERKNKNFVKVIALCLPLLLGACGTKKVVEGNGTTSTSQTQNANSSSGHQRNRTGNGGRYLLWRAEGSIRL